MKIYRVTFLKYTNATKNTVWNEKENEYLKVGNEPFLVMESQIDYIRKYGDGIETLTYVGILLE